MVTFKPRLLVVDDDPLVLQLLGDVLAQLKTEPQCIQSSLEAVKLVNARKFDGVFLDWMMPEMDGLELAREIRWSKSNSLCPIVMLTGNPEPDAVRQCFRAGINFFLPKPVTKENLKHMLDAAHDLMLLERIRYQRVPVQVPVACAWQVQAFEQEANGQSLNLSSTGMLVELDSTPVPDILVRLKFTLSGDQQPYLLTAFVARLTSSQKVALRFVNLMPEERRRLQEFSRSESNVG